jgi:sugar lactone lactonase YvrE
MTRGLGAALYFASCLVALAQPYVISTVAGGAPPPTGISAISASVSLPLGVTADASNLVYFSSNNTVFKIDGAGNLLRVAGNAHAGYSGDGGPATSAQLSEPYGVAFDSSANLYIADSGNNRIRKVTPNGIISTVAGTGAAGYSGDAGPATSAQLNFPVDVALDSAGNIYVADAYNQRVRKIANGIITTIAGDGTCCYSGDNGPATKAQLHQPDGLAVDSAGNVYIADLGNSRVRKVSTAGTITTVAGSGSSGTAGDGGSATSAQLLNVWNLAIDSAGNLFIADGDRVRKVSGTTINTVAGTQAAGFGGDGGAATKAQLSQPFGIGVDGRGNLLIADTGNNRVREVTTAGIIMTIAGDGTHNYSGDGGPATSAQLYDPQGIAVSATGTVYVSEYGRVRKFTPGGSITTVVGTGIQGYSGDGSTATASLLNQPQGLAVDASGTLFIADSANNRIRKVSASGNIALVAGTGTAGYSGDNGPATSAQLRDPEGLAMDAAGNLYIADTGNAVIRKISTTGTITTIAGTGTQGFAGDGGAATSAQFVFPRGVAVDSGGNLYVADFGNGRVRKFTPGGTITTIAGDGSNNLSPQGVAVDSAGNLYVADFNNAVFKILPDSTLSRIGGTGVEGYSGDGGSAASAMVSNVRSVALDPAGNIFFTDSSNDAIRMLHPVSALLTISTPAILPPGAVGAPYSQQLSAVGGTAALQWSVISGALPPGVTLSSAGLLAGTPSAVGTYAFTVQATDGASFANLPFTITVSVPSITTFSPLLQGTVGLAYSQTLSASGGALPYTWTLTSGTLPAGLTLSAAGVITGTPTTPGTANITVKLTDAAGSTTTQSFTLTVLAAPPLARSGVLAHIAAGGGWSTSIYLANTSSNQVAVALDLHADDGSALTLPLTITQQGASQPATSPSISAVISPNSTLVIDIGQQIAALVTGWVDLATSGPLSGFAIFRTTNDAGTSEGTSPLQTQFQSRIDLPYDNRNGFVTAVALANLAPAGATITATMWDSTGKLLGTQSISLPASGHTAFVITDQLPQTAGIQGIVQFQSTAGSLAGVGLRASPQGTFTSIPLTLP